MASPELTSALSALASSSSSEKSKGFNDLLTQIIKSPAPSQEQQAENLVAYIDGLFASSIGIITIRPLLSTLVQSLSSTNSEVKVRVGSHLVNVLQPQIASFEEQDPLARRG